MTQRQRVLNNIYHYNLNRLKEINPHNVYKKTDLFVGADDWLMITWLVPGKEIQRQVGEVCKRLHRRLNPRNRSKKGEQLTIE